MIIAMLLQMGVTLQVSNIVNIYNTKRLKCTEIRKNSRLRSCNAAEFLGDNDFYSDPRFLTFIIFTIFRCGNLWE